MAGKRKAVKPAKTPKATKPPQPAKVSKAIRTSSPERTKRPNRFARGFSVPTLVGLAAVLLAATGAISVGAGSVDAALASGNIQRLSGQANVLNGASSVGSSNPARDRQLAVSRDSRRQAEQDRAGQALQLEAEHLSVQRDAALKRFAAKAASHAIEVAKNAWGLPVVYGVYHLTAGFGDCSGLWSHCHTGLDFAAPSGTPIHAIANGVIGSASYDGSYGNKTVELLDDGTELWYAHQTSFAVSPGQHVVTGQVIGYVGSTGNVTGPHVHIEVRPGAGDPVDPYPAFIAHAVNPGCCAS